MLKADLALLCGLDFWYRGLARVYIFNSSP